MERAGIEARSAALGVDALTTWLKRRSLAGCVRSFVLHTSSGQCLAFPGQCSDWLARCQPTVTA